MNPIMNPATVPARTVSGTVATNCVCCGRVLTDETSIASGMGPVCRKHAKFDEQEVPADWGKALGALGTICPADVYEAVAAAHGVRKGHGEFIDTTMADTIKACRAIVHALAVALATQAPREMVVRYLLALTALGRPTLARHLILGFMKRREFRAAYPLRMVDVTASEMPEGKVFTVRCQRFDWDSINAMRALPYESRRFDKVAKAWRVTRLDAAQVFGVIKATNPDLIAGAKGAVAGKALPVTAEPTREWWADACREADRVCWVSRETGELVRYALPGEPVTRPGMEKVPAAFFGHTLAA